jgi:hypothetical protein
MNRLLIAVCSVLTAYTVARVGVLQAAKFQFAQGIAVVAWAPDNLVLSLWYTLPVLGILLAHELGHLVAARRYRVRVRGPYLLPWPLGFPILIPFGTLGAMLWLRDDPPSDVAVWDIASAGLIAGAVVSTLCVIVGGFWSVPERAHGASLWLPSIMRWVGADGVAWHPLVSAGWVGWILTAISLIPVKPLDGWALLSTIPTAWRERRWSLAAVAAVVIACLA